VRTFLKHFISLVCLAWLLAGLIGAIVLNLSDPGNPAPTALVSVLLAGLVWVFCKLVADLLLKDMAGDIRRWRHQRMQPPSGHLLHRQWHPLGNGHKRL
jgi:drug/metabolite transporter (DMT)-like permease